jgi:hypothetical protein
MGIYASMQVQVDDEGGAYGTNLTKGDVLVCAIRPGGGVRIHARFRRWELLGPGRDFLLGGQEL